MRGMMRLILLRRLAARSSSITDNNTILSSSSAAAAAAAAAVAVERTSTHCFSANGFHPALLNHSRNFFSPPSSDESFTPFSVKSIRHFGQAAKSEDEDEEVEIDQRRLPADYDPANFDPTEHRSPPTDRVWSLVDEISGLTLVETAELSTIMMRKLGMKEMPVVGVMKPGAAGVAMNTGAAAAKEEKKPEKTAFELKIESYDAASKLKVIKEIRSFTDLGLKEAKDLVEKTPSVLKKGVSKEEAEKIIEKMKAVGAVVVMD
ncbi:PREDICTED: 54S ribosomal protein L12, mitochondrial-like [Erythranthe guttata]|nr:PREDICTED: 54S ribosomal protein L12, mitochondrial-like [Erythranthe guttata]|eukprot:XP_012839840.1 PREDICTED: 54S ribosomal protein L12, mitochondrial-like [Erythranthe guttata]